MLVKGVQVEPIHPLPMGAWQCVRGPRTLQVGRGLQSSAEIRPRVQPGCAPGAKGRVETRLWEWWCFLTLLGVQGVCRLWDLPGGGSASISTGAQGLGC